MKYLYFFSYLFIVVFFPFLDCFTNHQFGYLLGLFGGSFSVLFLYLFRECD